MHSLSTFRRNTLTAAIAVICMASFQATANAADAGTPQATGSSSTGTPASSNNAPSGQDDSKNKNKSAVNLQQVVVTASPMASTEMDSSISVSTVDGDQIQTSGAQNAADLLRDIPGIRSESSGGAGNANVSVRGLPVASGGAKYVQYQIDGMPVLEFGDTAFATPDQFLRLDYNIDHVEAVRGGSSSIFASNAPGAILNFITKDGSQPGGDIGVTTGVGVYDYKRIDFDYGGSLSATTRYHFGGFVQSGNGQKNTGDTSQKGGQLMGNITHDIDGGFLRLNLQFTDTRDPVYLPVPLLITGSNSDPHISSIPGFNIQSGTLQSPYFSTDTALNAQGQVIHTNISNGYDTHVNAIGGEGKFKLGDNTGWTLDDKFRLAENYGAFTGPYATNTEDAQSFANSIGGAGSYYTYATDPNAGKRVTNPGTLGGNGYVEETALFNVSLPNMDNATNNLSLSRDFDTAYGDINLQFGYYHSQQNIVQDWHWNTYLQTVQSPDSVLLNLYNAAGKELTSNGLLAYGTPTFCDSCTRYYDAKYMMDAPFVSTTWETDNGWRFDGGLRFDRITGSGYYAQSNEYEAVNITGGSTLSVPEESVPVFTGSTSPIDYSLTHLEYSFGANYNFNQDLAWFVRASDGARFNSDRLLFGGGIEADGSVPNSVGVNIVKQYETGVKWSTPHTSLFVTAFMANTSETNEDVTNVLQPFINAVYHSRGVEFEGSVNYGHFSLSGGVTYTHSLIVSDSITPADVDNVPQRQANWVYQFSPSYSWHAFNVGATVIGTTKSYADDTNGLVMPGYTQVNAYVSYDINERMTASLSVNNLFNAIGLTEVDGSPADVTSNGLNTARSILGRTINISWKYHL